MDVRETPFLVSRSEEFIDNTIDIVDDLGVYIKDISLEKAMEKSFNLNLDLVCFIDEKENSNAFCKIIDFGKWKYNYHKKNKNKKEATTKEIRFSQSIDINDIKHKLKHAKELIENKHELIFTIRRNKRKPASQSVEKMKNILLMCDDFASASEIKVDGSVVSCKLKRK